MSLSFLTPSAALVAALCLIPLGVFLRTRAGARVTRRALGLSDPSRRAYVLPLGGFAAAAVLLGLAAAQPVVTLNESPTAGPATWLPRLVVEPILTLRNALSLQRLRHEVETARSRMTNA